LVIGNYVLSTEELRAEDRRQRTKDGGRRAEDGGWMIDIGVSRMGD